MIKDLSKASLQQMEALQSKELEILKYFKNICEENNLKFFLAGGTCIGALREGGFVPWDDDVDVFMMRKDYEKLYRNWTEYSKNSNYELCRADLKHNYRHAAMTLNDSRTTFINFRTEDEDVNQGIGIDIIPIDFIPEEKIPAFLQKINAILFSIFINQRLPDNQGTLLRKLTTIPLTIVKNQKARFKIWKGAEKKMTKYSYSEKTYAVELVTGLRAIFRPLKYK